MSRGIETLLLRKTRVCFMMITGIGWILWGCVLTYISVQDILRHAFSLGSVLILAILTVCLNPSRLGWMLGYGALYYLIKYGVERWRKTAYIGLGDVEILSVLSSQTEHIEWFFIVSGCLGMFYCVLFKQRGLPFVPVMSLAWCIVQIIPYIYM